MTVCVLQSHRTPLPHPWLVRCLESVADWATRHSFNYRFIGDELLDHLPDDLKCRINISSVIKSDLARLRAAQSLLTLYDTVIWLDADVLVLAPDAWHVPMHHSSVGRENWVQADERGRLRNFRKVHNAAMVFHRGDSLLGFYADTAERLLRANQTAMPEQFIGPKLLTALHNAAQLSVWESAGMMSPWVGRDVLGVGDGNALNMLREAHAEPVAALNMCSSSCRRGELSDEQMSAIIDTLLLRGCV